MCRVFLWCVMVMLQSHDVVFGGGVGVEGCVPVPERDTTLQPGGCWLSPPFPVDCTGGEGRRVRCWQYGFFFSSPRDCLLRSANPRLCFEALEASLIVVQMFHFWLQHSDRETSVAYQRLRRLDNYSRLMGCGDEGGVVGVVLVDSSLFDEGDRGQNVPQGATHSTLHSDS